MNRRNTLGLWLSSAVAWLFGRRVLRAAPLVCARHDEVRTGRYTFEDIRRVLNPDGPPRRRSLAELKEGIAQHIRARYAPGSQRWGGPVRMHFEFSNALPNPHAKPYARRGPRRGPMILFDAPLTLHEFVTKEKVPLATVFRAIGGFLARRRDVAVFGAHAVNAHVKTERMSGDVDVLSTRAGALAEELRAHLADSLGLSLRVREVPTGAGLNFRVDEVREPENRHLVDVRQADALPPVRVVQRVQFVAPAHLVAMKVVSIAARDGSTEGWMDRVDLHRLMNARPQLRSDGQVAEILRATSPSVLDLWETLSREHRPESDDDEW